MVSIFPSCENTPADLLRLIRDMDSENEAVTKAAKTALYLHCYPVMEKSVKQRMRGCTDHSGDLFREHMQNACLALFGRILRAYAAKKNRTATLEDFVFSEVGRLTYETYARSRLPLSGAGAKRFSESRRLLRAAQEADVDTSSPQALYDFARTLGLKPSLAHKLVPLALPRLSTHLPLGHDRNADTLGDLLFDEETPDPRKAALVNDRRDHVRAAVAKLPASQARVVEAVYKNGRRVADLATEEKCTAGSIRERMERAARTLRKELAQV